MDVGARKMLEALGALAAQCILPAASLRGRSRPMDVHDNEGCFVRRRRDAASRIASRVTVGVFFRFSGRIFVRLI